MGAICNIIESKVSRRDGQLSGTYRPSKWFVDWVTGGESSAGVHVTEQSALKYTPFWSAVRIISGTCGCLPFPVYRRLKTKGKERAANHPVYKLLHDRPNEYMDALTFIESRQAHVLTYGNGFAEIQRDGGGRPVALWPLQPNQTFRRASDDGKLYYEIQLPSGGSVFLPDYNVLHIKGLGFDGYTGYNVVRMHKEAIGYGVAVKEFGSRFFGNDASPGGVLEHPNTLSPEAYSRLKESWLEKHQGLSESHRIQILEEGMKFAKTNVDPEQAQALEVQKWNVDDCSRIFQIPPHMLGSMEFSKFNNVEQLELEFVKRTMLYWFRKWETEVNYKLFGPSEYGEYFAEILYEGLLRGDIKTRYECYNIGRNAGFLCVDDIREKENLNPLPDGNGQIFLEPLNMQPAGSEPEPLPRQKNNDNVKAAHRSLIVSQWLRIIPQLNGNKDKNKNTAAKILIEPVIAYASIYNRHERAKEILQKLLDEIINDKTKLTIYDADRLADLTLARIGGENA